MPTPKVRRATVGTRVEDVAPRTKTKPFTAFSIVAETQGNLAKARGPGRESPIRPRRVHPRAIILAVNSRFRPRVSRNWIANTRGGRPMKIQLTDALNRHH